MPQTENAARLLARLAEMPSTLQHRQKIADARDFADPRMDLICREAIGRVPRLAARLWEAARVYDLLAQAGALRPGSRGLGIGSGREVTLFAIADACAHLTVTDLYSAQTGWSTARTEDEPARFVLAAAPPGFDPGRITVRSMDARRLAFPDASFDFAYSVSSMEHFGLDPDFVDHLREVRRVLKPGGAYVLTTEMRFGSETLAVRGNHAFALAHLLDLVARAGLAAEPVIDARLTRVAENGPREYADVRDFGLAWPQDQVLMIREHAGVVSGPVALVLRAGAAAAPQVIGLADTIAWLEGTRRAEAQLRYTDWVRLNPFAANQGSRGTYCDLFDGARSGEGLVFCTGYVGFGEAVMEARVTLAGSEAEESAGSVTVAVNEWAIGDLSAMRRIHAAPLAFEGGRGQARQARFTFPAREGYRYSLFGAAAPGSRIRLSLADVLVRRARG